MKKSCAWSMLTVVIHCLNVGIPVRAQSHVLAHAWGAAPELGRPVQGAREKLHLIGDRLHDLRQQEIFQSLVRNAQRHPLPVELVVLHGDHLRGDDPFPEGLKAHREVLQRDPLVRLQIGFSDMLQDGALLVDPPQVFDQWHVAAPVRSFVELEVLRLHRHSWMGCDDRLHRASHEEHRKCLIGKKKPHFRLPGMECEENSPSCAVAAAGVVHELLARAIAELR